MTEYKKRLARQNNKHGRTGSSRQKKQQQAKEAAAVENSWASCHNMKQKRDSKKRLTNRIFKYSLPTQRKTPTASSKM